MMNLWKANLPHKIVNNTQANERVYLFGTECNAKSRQVLSREIDGFLQVKNQMNRNRRVYRFGNYNWVMKLPGVIINDKKIPHTEKRHEYLIFAVADVYTASLLINEFS